MLQQMLKKITYRVDGELQDIVEILDLNNIVDMQHYNYIMENYDVRKVEKYHK